MSSSTLLEQFVANLNSNIFLAEFAFAGSQFLIKGHGHVEIADHLVVLEEIGILFQLKERDPAASSEDAEVIKWFANKILKKAVMQLRQTRELLRKYPSIKLTNERGHEVMVRTKEIVSLYNVVIYRKPESSRLFFDRFCRSRAIGFVHLISDVDWLGICEYLVTPPEISDYLTFRQKVLSSHIVASSVTEAGLVGQFIGSHHSAPPSREFEGVLAALREDRSAWDMSWFVKQFGDKITGREGDGSHTSHYRILSEFAKLSRSELREFKKRFSLAIGAVEAGRFELPYRFASSRTECGFLVIPITPEFAQHAKNVLHNLAAASKHDFRVRRHVSLTIVRDSPYFDIAWLFDEGTEKATPEIEALLHDHYPFRRSSEQILPRYILDSVMLDASLQKARNE